MFEQELKALGRSPWTKVTHAGEEFMVRANGEAHWAFRIRDRAVWLWDTDMTPPAWVLEALRTRGQQEMFA